jgi:hypothetical protein
VKLPNGERAIVDIMKLRDYALSESHPRGRHKARVFLAALGLAAADTGELQAVLLETARVGDAVCGAVDEFGTLLHHRFRGDPFGEKGADPLLLDHLNG